MDENHLNTNNNDPDQRSSMAELKLINQFALDMLAINTLNDLLWKIAEDVGKLLHFDDFVVYLVKNDALHQSASFGIKSLPHRRIKNALSIPIGKGIVGNAVVSRKMELVKDLTQDSRYIKDQTEAKSELTIPLLYHNDVIAVFDAESLHIDGFTDDDCRLLQTFAYISAPRIASALSEHERTLVENQLISAEVQYRTLIEKMPDPIVIHADNKAIYANDATMKLFGYERDEFMNLPIHKHMREKDWHVSEQRQEDVLAGVQVELLQVPYLKKDGSIIYCETYGYLSKFQGKDAIISVMRDITPRYRAEKAAEKLRDELEDRVIRRTAQLERSEQQVRLLLDSTAEAIYGLDMDGKCTFCNPACIEALGYQNEEALLGKNMHALAHYQYANGAPYHQQDCNIFKSYRTGKEVHIDNEVFWRADGTSFPAEYWSHPITINNEIIGSVVTFLDITERKQLEAQQYQLQKMQALGKLAGGIAHDLNNILTPVLGYAEMLAVDAEESANNKHLAYAQSIGTSAKRAQKLVAQILLFSQRRKINQSVTNIYSLLPELLSFLRSTLSTAIDIKLEAETEEAFATCNSSQIYQVILNFGINAGQAISAEGEGHVIIGLKIVELKHVSCIGNKILIGKHIQISITDDGGGIDKDTIDHIFEPFFTTKATGAGTGLGLSTAFGIAENHDGGIRVKSTVGVGTRFDLLLPHTDALVFEMPPPYTAKPTHVTGNLLIVDDEEAITNLCKLSLEQDGFKVTTATDGKAALEILSKDPTRFDLVITDYAMPHMTGTNLAIAIQKLNKDIKIILSSGYTELIVRESGMPPGINKLLNKPFSPKALKDIVVELLLS